MRCAIPSPPTCWRAAATCARSRSCSVTPRCRPRRSTPRSIPNGCWKRTATRIRAHDKTVTAIGVGGRPLRGRAGRTINTPCEIPLLRYIVRAGQPWEGQIMSHGVHAVQHEVEHEIEHEKHGNGGGHGKGIIESINKKVALLIAVIALFLAFSETLGKSAQTAALSYNVEASNLWAFYQAKTIRQTAIQAATELLKFDRMKIDGETSPDAL